jgi:hypothetical protein
VVWHEDESTPDCWQQVAILGQTVSAKVTGKLLAERGDEASPLAAMDEASLPATAEGASSPAAIEEASFPSSVGEASPPPALFL